MSAPNPKPTQKYPGYYFTRGEWEQVLAKHDNKCAHCGCDGKLTVDHIEPRCGYYGPEPDVLTNIQPLCKACNMKKGSRKPDGTKWDIRETSWYQEVLKKEEAERQRRRAYAERLAAIEKAKLEEKARRAQERESKMRHTALLVTCMDALGISEREVIFEAVAYLATRKDVREALANAIKPEEEA